MRRSLFWPTLLCATSAASWCLADGGYYSGNRGAHAAGRAGAFTAKADDLSAAMYNPAGLARLDSHLIQIGNRFSYNAHEFTRAPTLDWESVNNGAPPYVEFSRVENGKPWQWLEPFVGFGSNFGLDDWGFALVVYAPPGVGRQEFPVDGGQRYVMVSREAQILNYTLSAAWQASQKFGVGASLQWIDVALLDYRLVIDASMFEGDANPVSSPIDMLAQVRGADHFTPNAILGLWYRPTPFLELGLSGQVIPAQIETHSTLTIVPLGEDVGDDVELRRDGKRADDVRLTLPLPLSARAGIRYFQETDGQLDFDVELDVTYETWSRTDAFTLDTNHLTAELLEQTLDIDRIQIEKEWRDTIGLHLGGDYTAIPGLLTLRGGLFYESAVAAPEYAAVDFVSGQQLGGNLGASVFIGKLEAAFGYGYRRQPAITVRESDARVYQETPGSECGAPYDDPDLCHPEYLGQPAPAVNAGRYRAYHHTATLDLLYRF